MNGGAGGGGGGRALSRSGGQMYEFWESKEGVGGGYQKRKEKAQDWMR